MTYSSLLKGSIKESGLKLDKLSSLIFELTGNKPSKEYLSKLQNGKVPPAGEKLNKALAEILEIDQTELKVAAYKEKIPKDVLNHLINDGEKKEVVI